MNDSKGEQEMTSRFRKTVGQGDLKKRTEESYNSKDDSGKFRGYIKSSIPIKQWKCDEGDHVIDILPWLAGKNNPNGLEENDGTHKVEVFAHYGIGVNENSYVCPQLTIGKPCPICEYRNAMKKEDNYDEDAFKALNAKRRVIYQVCVFDTPKTEAAGVMYWDASFHLAEKNIVALAKNNRTGEFIPFADPDKGKTIEFTREGKGITTDYTALKFTEREPIPDDVLDQCVCLDDYIEILSYEELTNALGLSNKRQSSSPPTPPPSRRQAPVQKEEEYNDDLPFDNGSSKGEESEPAQPTRRPRREETAPEPVVESKPEERPTRLRRTRRE